jgi:hypothetical protein
MADDSSPEARVAPLHAGYGASLLDKQIEPATSS